VLFTGTVRSNLDPFSEKADHEVWEALEKVDLKAAILKLDGKLSAVVVENGMGFYWVPSRHVGEIPVGFV